MTAFIGTIEGFNGNDDGKILNHDGRDDGQILSHDGCDDGNKAETMEMSGISGNLSYSEISKQYPELGSADSIRKRMGRIKTLYPNPESLTQGEGRLLKVTPEGVKQLLLHHEDAVGYKAQYAGALAVSKPQALEQQAVKGSQEIKIDDIEEISPDTDLVSAGNETELYTGKGVTDAVTAVKTYQVARKATEVGLLANASQNEAQRLNEDISANLRQIQSLDQQLDKLSQMGQKLNNGSGFDLKKSLGEWGVSLKI